MFNVECNAMVDMTSTRPLDKGQGHLFRYQSISHNITTSYKMSILAYATFALVYDTIQ